MVWFNNLSFRYKLLLPIGLLVVVFVYLAATALLVTQQMSGQMRMVSGTELPGVALLLEADRDVYQAQVAERSMIFVDVASDNFQKLRAEHAENVQQARERVAQFISLAQAAELGDDARIGTAITRYQQQREAWEKLTNEAVEQRASDTRSGRSTAIDISFGSGSAAFQAMRASIDELSGLMTERATAHAQESEATSRGSSINIGIVVVIGLLICAIVAWFFPRLVTRPLNELTEHIEDIAKGGGDLTVRLDVTSRDEMGRVAAAFNNFIASLQELISQSKESTDRLSGAAQRLSALSAESNQSAVQQLDEIDQVATAINQMSATVQEVARNAGDAANSAREADQQSVNGQQVVSDSIATITALAASVQNAADVIQKLNEESSNIGAVLGVIRGIAEQTNLLALNAAIEAARAGEQGRGFAVVADEVRSLASRTQQSTQEIQQMIAALQGRARDAVEAMERGRNSAGSSVEQAEKAGAALLAITRSVAAISDMNNQIASAAEQQSSVTEEINRNTTNIQALANQATDGSRQTAAAADELTALADILETRLGRFKV